MVAVLELPSSVAEEHIEHGLVRVVIDRTVSVSVVPWLRLLELIVVGNTSDEVSIEHVVVVV